jgi:endonuclease III
MSKNSRVTIAQALLKMHGKTFSEELGIKPRRNMPSDLFRLLCASLLFSTRISADIARDAAKALFSKGWTTPRKMAKTTWEQRTRTLNRAGYARYDESTSSRLGEAASKIIDRYNGDLRKLRDEANHDPGRERELIKQFKGIGDVGADIFFREVQGAWDELFPYADKKILEQSQKLGLGASAAQLQKLVKRKDYPRLTAALIRTRLAKDEKKILEMAKRA